MNILAIISLGNKIGSGHYGRTLNLVERLKDKNSNILFLFNRKYNFKKDNIKTNFDFCNFNHKKSLISKISEFNPNLIILDSYILNYKTKKKIYEINKNVLTIDDNLNQKHICKYYLNYNIFDKRLKKKLRLNVKSKKNFLGPQFFLSGKYFHKKTKINSKQVLIFLGSTNEDGILEKTLDLLNDKIFHQFKFTVILSKFRKIKINKGLLNFKFYKNMAQKNYLKLLSKSTYFITSGGVSSWDGLTLKKKLLVFATANNQLNSIKNLKKLKVLNYMGKSRNFNHKKNKVKLINYLIKSKSKIYTNNINKLNIGKKLKYLISYLKKNDEK